MTLDFFIGAKLGIVFEKVVDIRDKIKKYFERLGG